MVWSIQLWTVASIWSGFVAHPLENTQCQRKAEIHQGVQTTQGQQSFHKFPLPWKAHTLKELAPNVVINHSMIKLPWVILSVGWFETYPQNVYFSLEDIIHFFPGQRLTLNSQTLIV